jgi:hypothetical protein
MDKTIEQKKELLRKYAQGLEEIWKRMVDEGPDSGDPLDLFEPAIQLTEKTLSKLMS